MLTELERRINEGRVRVVIFYSAKKQSFIVGADLNMLYPITEAKGMSARGCTKQASTWAEFAVWLLMRHG